MQFKAVPVLRASGLRAQVVLDSTSLPSRFSVGENIVMSQPRGEFASNVGRGHGFDLNGLLKLDYRGFVSIRADVGGVQYRRERKDASFFRITDRNSTLRYRVEKACLRS